MCVCLCVCVMLHNVVSLGAAQTFLLPHVDMTGNLFQNTIQQKANSTVMLVSLVSFSVLVL